MISQQQTMQLFFDGGSLGNPGLARCGCVLYREGREIWTDSYKVGDYETNNKSEYTGLVRGLEYILRCLDSGKWTPPLTVEVFGDSLLVISQMTGKYRVKSPSLKEIYLQAKSLEEAILRHPQVRLTFTHIPREQNISLTRIPV